MERERHLSLFLGTELVTMFIHKAVQISQAKTYFFYLFILSWVLESFRLEFSMLQMPVSTDLFVCTCEESFSPNKNRVKELVLTNWPEPKNCLFKVYKLYALLQRAAKLTLHINFTHWEHFIRFDWISLNYILPLHNVLQTTAERVSSRSSIYLLGLSYWGGRRGGRKNLHMIIRVPVDLSSLIICKLWLQLSTVLYEFPFPYHSRQCCVQALAPRGTQKQDLFSICSVSI